MKDVLRLRHIPVICNHSADGMNVLATIALMVSLLAMSVTVASADISRPSCSSQMRADNLCHAAGLPGSAAETVKKPGICLVCLIPADGIGLALHRETRVRTALGATILSDARRTVPWRPPRG